MPTPDLWMPDHIAITLRMNADGFSKAQIAAELALRTGSSFTRNAVIAKLTRMGVASPAKLRVVAAPSILKRSPKPRMTAEQYEARAPKIAPVTVISRDVMLMDLQSDQCRYPSGDGLGIRFCGHTKIKGSYCPEHTIICRGIGTASERAASKTAPSLVMA